MYQQVYISVIRLCSHCSKKNSNFRWMSPVSTTAHRLSGCNLRANSSTVKKNWNGESNNEAADVIVSNFLIIADYLQTRECLHSIMKYEIGFQTLRALTQEFPDLTVVVDSMLTHIWFSHHWEELDVGASVIIFVVRTWCTNITHTYPRGTHTEQCEAIFPLLIIIIFTILVHLSQIFSNSTHSKLNFETRAPSAGCFMILLNTVQHNW